MFAIVIGSTSSSRVPLTHDRFGRLLRYVYLEDGRMVNEVLVRNGFAAVSSVPPDVQHIDLLLIA